MGNNGNHVKAFLKSGALDLTPQIQGDPR